MKTVVCRGILRSDLLVTHERRPFPDSAEDIQELASNIKDPNYRIKVAEKGIYMFNRDGLMQDIDPFAFYPQLDLKDDTGHAFYLGAELARAQIAWQLGKRYTQDEALEWGCAVSKDEQDLTEQKRRRHNNDNRKNVAQLESKIHEVIVTTLSKDGSAHSAPMGISEVGGHFLIQPFKPSATYEILNVIVNVLLITRMMYVFSPAH